MVLFLRIQWEKMKRKYRSVPGKNGVLGGFERDPNGKLFVEWSLRGYMVRSTALGFFFFFFFIPIKIN